MTSSLNPIGQAVPFVGIDSQGKDVRIHPQLLRWFQTDLGARVGGSISVTVPELSDAVEKFQTQLAQASPGTYLANLATDIPHLAWASLGRIRPTVIQTGGYDTPGLGAASYFLESSPGVDAPYRFRDAEGNSYALPHDLVQPEQVGARADGVTDDTAAFAVCTQSGHFISMRLVGSAYVATVQPAPGFAIIGYAGLGYTNDEVIDRPAILKPPASQAVIDFGYLRDSGGHPIAVRGCTLAGILLDGGGVVLDGGGVPIDNFGVSGGSNRLRAMNVDVIGCSVGWGGQVLGVDGVLGSAYTHSLRASGCTSKTCDVGMRQFVDSEFINCEIANCTTYGLHGLAGANAVTWTGGRIEFTQSGDNINLNACELYQFSNFMIDRGWETSLTLIDCDNITFNGITFNRGGASDTGVTGTSCDVFMQGNKKVSFTGCNWHAQHDDGGVGITTPRYAIVFNQTNEDVVISGGSVGFLYDGITNSPLDGYTVAPILYNSGLNTTQMPRHKITGVGGLENYDNYSILQQSDGRQFYAGSGSSGVLAPGASFVFTMNAPPVITFDADGVTLRVFTRDETHPTTGILAHAKFDLLIHQEAAGTMAITPTSVYAEIPATAGAIAFGAGSIQLSISAVTTATDGTAQFNVTALNSHVTDSIRVWARLNQ